MPRGFSESQTRIVREKLIAAACEALKNVGARKTTVQDLTKDAGISVGAFYKFYSSKEALFFEAYEIAEEQLKGEFLAALQTSTDFSPSLLGLTLRQILDSQAMAALLLLMKKEEMDYILRNMDPALVHQHMQKDNEFLRDVIERLRTKGLNIKIDKSTLLDYLQALFVLCYEKHQYAQHSDQIIGSFIDTIINQAIG